VSRRGRPRRSRPSQAGAAPARAQRPGRRREPSATPAAGLRDRLLDAATTLIAEVGPRGFSLREVARRARVSEAAPYWHFDDKEALLAAVAERGFIELAASMQNARPVHDDPLSRFQALGIAYVRFALRHPSYLRVMFGAAAPSRAAHPSLMEAAGRTFEMLVAAIVEAQRAQQVVAGNPEDLAIAGWSLTHGLAELLVDGKLRARAASEDDIEALARRVTEILGLGLIPR
jgi:AcrR family transcriptional regulator